MQNSTRIVPLPLTPLEIKDERFTVVHTMHSPHKITVKGQHLGLYPILESHLGAPHGCGSTVSSRCHHHRCHSVTPRHHSSSKVEVSNFTVHGFTSTQLHSGTTPSHCSTPFAGVFLCSHCDVNERAVMMPFTYNKPDGMAAKRVFMHIQNASRKKKKQNQKNSTNMKCLLG